jgi:hypothetical protein
LPELEAVVLAMNTAALLSLAERFNLRPPIHRWEAAGLPGVACGRELFASGQLRRLADTPGLTIQHVLQELDRLWEPQAANIDAGKADGLDSGPAYPPPLVLIVTGAPASGKTTLGRQLANALGLPYFSKDLFKESLFDSLGWQDRAWSQRVGGASTAVPFR